MQPFLLDGVAYNVHVTKLIRKFSVLDSDKSGRTMDGRMYRDPIGTFYNYEMTICQRDSDVQAMDRFWEVISQPAKSHVCTFPYNQQTLTQNMYVTSGTQELFLMTGKANRWGELTVSFVAMEPRVVP